MGKLREAVPLMITVFNKLDVENYSLLLMESTITSLAQLKIL